MIHKNGDLVKLIINHFLISFFDYYYQFILNIIFFYYFKINIEYTII